jgi:hypothetical protein
MAIIAWSASKTEPQSYAVNTPALRRALSIATDDVRSSAAWEFATFFRHIEKNDKSVPPKENPWPRLGTSFFKEVWPLEPALQSGNSANDFARIPVRTGSEHYPEAIRTVLPYLRPFKVWDVDTDLGLDVEAQYLVKRYPGETLALIDACVGNDWGIVYRLGPILAVIRQSRSELSRDPRMRRLARHVGRDE